MNEDKRIAAPSSNDELSIDLYSIFLDVSKEWLSIFLLTVSVVLISYVVLTNFRALNYSTSATMVINNDDGSDGVKTSSTPEVYENIYNGADSASRITGIFESKALKETVAKELGLKSFSGTISAKTLGESNLLKITVRSVSPYISYREAESVLKNYEKFSKDLVGGTELTVLERPKVPERVEHPLQNLQYSVYAGILTFIIRSARYSTQQFRGGEEAGYKASRDDHARDQASQGEKEDRRRKNKHIDFRSGHQFPICRRYAQACGACG